MCASAVGGKEKNGDINQVPYSVITDFWELSPIPAAIGGRAVVDAAMPIVVRLTKHL